MKPFKHITTREDVEYSRAEEIRIQLKKMDKNTPEYEDLLDELDGLDEEEYETFTQSLYRIMK